MHPTQQHTTPTLPRTAAAVAAWPVILAGALAVAMPTARAEDLPTFTGEKANLTGGITPVGDVDTFSADLFPGERVTVKVKDAGPARGLISTLRLFGPDGNEIPVSVSRQGSRKPSFKYEATQTGSHIIQLTGDPGGFGGAEGNYTLTTKIKRTKLGKRTLDVPAGGEFAIPIDISEGASLDVKLKTKKGGFDVAGLFRPDGLPEPGFVDSLKTKGRTSAKGKKFAVTGGFGTYQLRGSYDAGSKVKVSVNVRHEAGVRKARLTDDEPQFDPFLAPFPSSGITGSLITIVGQNLVVGKGNSRSDVTETIGGEAGGPFAIQFAAVNDSLLDLVVSSTGGGFEVTELMGPDGRIENAFIGSLVTEHDDHDPRTFVTTNPVAPYVTTRGPGLYELRGVRDAGASVKVELTVVRGDGADPDRMPRVWIGSLEIDPMILENPFDQVLRFRVPEGLEADEAYDIRIRNADGQGAIAPDAFFFVPPPEITSLTETEAGPAGGRSLRIFGFDFRPDATVLFDDIVVQPSFVLSGRIDVVAPAHPPGDVTVRVRDNLGQIAVSPVTFTYLDIGSNEISSVDPASFQGIGGETVTVSGMDFGADSVLRLDGQPLDATRLSATEMTFVAPEHEGGTFELSVIDDYEQMSSVDVDIRAFTDVSDSSIPAPITTEGSQDAWRASLVRRGDVTGDGTDDLVIVRSAQAFGDDADRPRVRILAGDGEGGYTDATDGIPAVTTTDDWRARGAVLVDVDDDNDLDIALITDDELDGGDRSSLRLLLNDGDGEFTDGTTAAMPAATTAGDHNQGVAIVAVDVDGQNGPDLVIIHTAPFQETIDESPPLPDPPPTPLPDPVLVTYYYPGTRVLLNDGDGIFTRKEDALPALDADSLYRFAGDTIDAADVDGANGVDLVLTSDDLVEDPDSAGAYLRRAVLLTNDGGGLFTDESDTWLPSGSGADYLQGDGVLFVDYDGNGRMDLVVCSDTRLVTPGSGATPDVSALRILENDGSSFTDVTADVLPGLDGDDALQCHGTAFGDLTGDGRADIFLVSSRAPNVSEHAARVLVWTGDRFVRGSEGLPSPLLDDDGRGRTVILHDVDGDGDLDAVIGRNESDQTTRNTRVFRNPRVD